MSKQKLLVHQKKAVDSLINALNGSDQRVSLALPMGTGRMIVIGEFLSACFSNRRINSDSKVLIVSNRLDILNQVALSLREYVDEVTIGDANSESSGSIVHLITIQHIAKNENYFLSPRTRGQYAIVILLDADYLGVDSVAGTLNKLIGEYGDCRIISVINPSTEDVSLFGKQIFRYTIEEAIRDGLLVPPRVVKLNAQGKELGDIPFLHSDNIDVFAKSLLKIIGNQKTIVYCRDQVQATSLSNRLKELSHNSAFAEAVLSNSSNYNDSINRFRDSETPRVLTNVEMLGAGPYLPNVEVVAFVRPVRSQRWLAQKVISGMHSFPGKSELIILDYVGLLEVLTKIFNSVTISEREVEESTHRNDFFSSRILIRDKESINAVIGVQVLASELARLIEHMPNEQGKMIGVFGRWGRGKTFAFEETWKVLEKGGKFERIDFHAWKYQDTPALWAYVFEKFAEKYYNSGKNWWEKLKRRIYLNRIRLGWYKILSTIVSILFSIVWAFLFDFNFKWNLFVSLISALTVGGLINIFLLYINYEKSAKDLFKKVYYKISFSNQLGIQAEVNKELRNLIKAWSSYLKHRKLILFVDDIDRCSEDKIIQIIDSLRVVLEDELIGEKLVILAAIDERILKRSIKSKYIESVKSDVKDDDLEITLNTLTREYIDKLFILGIRLGDLHSDERLEYFEELIKDDRKVIDSATNSDEEVDRSLPLSEGAKIRLDNDMKLVPELSLAADRSEVDVASISEEGEKLTDVEVEMLKDCLEKFETATPRQIRIFYFRYLLSKNILISRYKANGKVNLWIDPIYASIMMSLIIQYGWFTEVKSISRHIDLVRSSSETEVKVFQIDDRFVPKDDYLELLMVLDIVTAY